MAYLRGMREPFWIKPNRLASDTKSPADWKSAPLSVLSGVILYTPANRNGAKSPAQAESLPHMLSHILCNFSGGTRTLVLSAHLK